MGCGTILPVFCDRFRINHKYSANLPQMNPKLLSIAVVCAALIWLLKPSHQDWLFRTVPNWLRQNLPRVYPELKARLNRLFSMKFWNDLVIERVRLRLLSLLRFTSQIFAPVARIRFTLRNLAIVLALISIPLAQTGMVIREGVRRESAIARLRRAGFNIQAYETTFLSRFRWLFGRELRTEARSIEGSGRELDIAVLRDEIVKLPTLFSISIDNARLDDDSLAFLGQLPNLRKIAFTRCEVSGLGLQFVANPEKLTSLNLSSSKVTRSGIETITRFEQLRDINLSGTDIGDAEIEELSKLKKVVVLDLDYTLLTDDGLRQNSFLASCENLKLVCTNVTENTYKEFVKFAVEVRREMAEKAFRENKKTLGYSAGEISRIHLEYYPPIPSDCRVSAKILEDHDVRGFVRDSGDFSFRSDLDRLLATLNRKPFSSLFITTSDKFKPECMSVLAEFSGTVESMHLRTSRNRLINPSAFDDFTQVVKAMPVLPKLSRIHLWSGDITSATVQSLSAAKLPSLKAIFFSECSLSSDAINRLGQIPTLNRVEIEMSDLDDIGLAALVALPQVKEIKVSGKMMRQD